MFYGAKLHKKVFLSKTSRSFRDENVTISGRHCVILLVQLAGSQIFNCIKTCNRPMKIIN